MKTSKTLIALALAASAFAVAAQTATPAAPAASGAYVAPTWKYKIKELSYQQIDALLAQPEKLVVLDVRRPDELIQYGSFPAFLNIQNSQLNDKNPDLKKFLAYLPKDRAILTVSNHAQRAGAVGDFLVSLGYNVVGAAGSEDYEKEGGKNVSHIKPPPPRVPGAASAPRP
jgi:rhodanese-related sulfurtransferase